MAGTVWKTVLSLAFLLIGAFIGWQLPVLAIPALIAVIVLAIIIWRMSVKNPLMVLLFAVVEGVVVGGISGWIDQLYPDLVRYALLATAVAFVVIVSGYSSGLFRLNPSKRHIFYRVLTCYLVFSVAAVVVAFTGYFTGFEYMGTGWVIFFFALCLVGIWLAVYSLMMDLEWIRRGIDNHLGSEWEWLGAFSLIGSLVWFYYEVLEFIHLLLVILGELFSGV